MPDPQTAQLQHEIAVHLAQALYHGWVRPMPSPNTSYSRPSERSPGGVVTFGEMPFAIERYLTQGGMRRVIGVDTVITTTQYRRALAKLAAEHQAGIVAYLGRQPMHGQRYPALSDPELAAFAELAYALGLSVTVLREVPATEPRKTVTDLFAPRDAGLLLGRRIRPKA